MKFTLLLFLVSFALIHTKAEIRYDSLHYQEFEVDTLKRTAIFHHFQGSNLNFKITFEQSKHTSVILNVYNTDGTKSLKRWIFSNEDVFLSTKNVERITMRHKKRLGIRFRQKFNEKKSKSKKKSIKRDRVDLSTTTTGGSTTKTVVTST